MDGHLWEPDLRRGLRSAPYEVGQKRSIVTTPFLQLVPVGETPDQDTVYEFKKVTNEEPKRALPVELPRDRRLGAARCLSCRN
ncbi:hypothetical protein ABIB95_005771 [Bradyrhizobium sp. LA2.1]